MAGLPSIAILGIIHFMTTQQEQTAVSVPSAPHNREAIGWTFLIGGFVSLLLILIAAIFSVGYVLQNGRYSLPTILIAQQGSVRINDASGVQRAVSAADPPEELPDTAQLLTDLLVSGEITVYPREGDGGAIAQMQLYSNADLTFDHVDTPRFSSSDQPHRLEMNLAAGRLRLTVPDFDEQPLNKRPLHTFIHTPHGDIFINQPGQYSITVDEEQTQTAVLDGIAAITRADETLILNANELGEMGTDFTRLQVQSDMVQAATFDNDWANPANPWQVGGWNVERAGQPPGSVKVVQSDDESVLQIVRNGIGHADISVAQAIGQEIAAESLWLQLDLRVFYHDLDVCGVLGSECPLFVQVAYEDENGNANEWRQGFYGHGIGSPSTPYICYNCGGAQNGHVPVTMEARFLYDIDLMAALAQQGAPAPARITGVTLTASGHNFAVAVDSLHLLAMNNEQ